MKKNGTKAPKKSIVDVAPAKFSFPLDDSSAALAIKIAAASCSPNVTTSATASP